MRQTKPLEKPLITKTTTANTAPEEKSVSISEQDASKDVAKEAKEIKD